MVNQKTNTYPCNLDAVLRHLKQDFGPPCDNGLCVGIFEFEVEKHIVCVNDSPPPWRTRDRLEPAFGNSRRRYLFCWPISACNRTLEKGGERPLGVVREDLRHDVVSVNADNER